MERMEIQVEVYQKPSPYRCDDLEAHPCRRASRGLEQTHSPKPNDEENPANTNDRAVLLNDLDSNAVLQESVIYILRKHALTQRRVKREP